MYTVVLVYMIFLGAEISHYHAFAVAVHVRVWLRSTWYKLTLVYSYLIPNQFLLPFNSYIFHSYLIASD